MMCEICKKNSAKIHVTQVREGKKTTIHICPECAHEKGVAGPALNTSFSVDQILGGYEKVQAEQDPEKLKRHTCSFCGLSYNGFRESGRLGCPQCYETFMEELSPILQKVQKDLQHVGKVPSQGNKKVELKRNIADYKRQLKTAIDKEHFEEAARLRDQIRDMERELLHLEEKAE
jgi:protein arginine kinase activator